MRKCVRKISGERCFKKVAMWKVMVMCNVVKKRKGRRKILQMNVKKSCKWERLKILASWAYKIKILAAPLLQPVIFITSGGNV